MKFKKGDRVLLRPYLPREVWGTIVSWVGSEYKIKIDRENINFYGVWFHEDYLISTEIYNSPLFKSLSEN